MTEIGLGLWKKIFCAGGIKKFKCAIAMGVLYIKPRWNGVNGIVFKLFGLCLNYLVNIKRSGSKVGGG